MKLLVSWLRDFVDVTASVDAIADGLALRGFEYASVERLGDTDGVIDFEVTANRPDCLGVLGFAREVAALYDLPVRLPSPEPGARIPVATVTTGASPYVKVTLEDADLCPRYAAAVAQVEPGASPEWITSRLQAAGVRPISAFVDITNYVLMELGHPMHAFDLAALAGSELRIRTARPGEQLTTLDGMRRTLEGDMLVIADAQQAQAIAGVMGGAASEVSETTRTVAFESAYFSPASIRRTSKRLGLKTEASARFERGADINAPVLAVQRAIALMQQIGAGRALGPIVDRYPSPRGPRTLALRRERLALVLGLEVPDRDVERILRALGLQVARTAGGWSVEAPTYRVDLLREVDLIEEVGRHYGFDKLEPAFPAGTAAAPPPDPRIARDQLVRRVAVAAGLSEAVTFGVIEGPAARAFADEGGTSVISIANPLSAKFEALRPSLLPGLLDAVAHNRRHGRREVGLFEIGARFTAKDGESRGIGIAWTGLATATHWSGSARPVDFFDAKGLVEQICTAIGVEAAFEPVAAPFLAVGQAARVRVAGSAVGLVGQVAPALAESRGAPRQDAVFVAELNLDALGPLHGPEAMDRVTALPRHPAVVRDISVVVADTLPAGIIRGTIQTAAAGGAAPLGAVAFFDRYKGRGVADDRVSLSVRLTFQAPDRTLTDAEVQASVDRILAALVREHQAVQR
jgi:phenylalanyl-tRNA synthetase beta chain